MCVGPEREVRQLARLPGGRLSDLGATVADLADEQACQSVQVSPAALVEYVIALTAHDDLNVAVVVARHPGEVQPHVPLRLRLEVRDLVLAVLATHLVP